MKIQRATHKKRHFQISGWLALPILVIPLALTGCTKKGVLSPGGTGMEEKTEIKSSYNRFPDLPMPVNAELMTDEILVFGTNDTWIGRIVIKTGHAVNDMFDFYKQEMPGFGWREITSIRAAISVLTYIRAERVATLQVQEAGLSGSKVLISVSPQGAEVIGGGVDQKPLDPPPAPPAE